VANVDQLIVKYMTPATRHIKGHSFNMTPKKKDKTKFNNFSIGARKIAE